MREVTVKLKWSGAGTSGRALYAGEWQVGFVCRALKGEGFIAVVTNRAGNSICHPTEAEAKDAVEKAAIEALEG
jgi:ABC-type uncharacterized transport system permease subunit